MDASKQENQELSAFRLSDTILNRQLSKNRGHNLYVSSFITYVLNLPGTYSPECLKHSIRNTKFDISNSYEYERLSQGRKVEEGKKRERERGREGGRGRERSFLEQNAS